MAESHPIPTHPGFKDLTGRIFGQLTVLAYAGPAPGHQLWLCRCSCGREVVIRSNNLLTGHNKGCGCQRKNSHAIHRMARAPEYTCWQRMIARCNNPKNPSYASYGGRGIRVCSRWVRSFQAFLADMGRRPSPRHSIERLDNDGPYSPSNCCWATVVEQANNKRTSCRLTIFGLTLTIAQWAQRSGIPMRTVWARIRQLGWSAERAVTTPVRPQPRSKIIH